MGTESSAQPAAKAPAEGGASDRPTYVGGEYLYQSIHLVIMYLYVEIYLSMSISISIYL